MIVYGSLGVRGYSIVKRLTCHVQRHKKPDLR